MLAIKKRLKRMFAISRLEPQKASFAHLFPRGAKITRIATGFGFTEGPVWIAEGGFLLFTDIPASRIYKLLPDGRLTVFREPTDNANGLTRDAQGRLIACEHATRRVSRMEPDGSLTVLADQFQGKRLNSPNDVVVKSDGSIYFTDPPYGISLDQQEQPIQGVYRLSSDGRELRVVAHDFDRPNGLAFSPNETQLYIDDSSARRHIRVFDVKSDGSIANGRIFHDMDVKAPGVPDGMKVDINGCLFCTGARGVWVFNENGVHLGTIVTPENPANCAWGDDDLRTLYITAQTSVYRVRVNVPGMPVRSPKGVS